MKYLLLSVGRAAYWLLLPVWYVYFRLNPIRTRVLLLRGDEIFLIRNSISRGEWRLPGGGAKRHESLQAAASRELREELRLDVDPGLLEPSGEYPCDEAGIKFTVHFFSNRPADDADISPVRPEIAEGRWFARDELLTLRLSPDTVHALKQAGML